MIIVDWSCMCKTSGNTVGHLLLHYEVARVLWDDVLRRIELAWIMQAIEVELVTCWLK